MQISKKLFFIIAIIAFIGFTDAIFLSANALSGNVPPCLVTGGCEQVTTSAYSRIAGIPIALFGTIFYLVMFGFALAFIERENKKVLTGMVMMSSGAFLFSLWLLYAQVFIIEALCSYCLISATTSTLLFLLSLYAWKKYRQPPININAPV